MKKILVYRWGSVCENIFIKALKMNGIAYAELSEKIKDYHADAEFALKIITAINREKADAVFSYDYFPIISSICEINNIPYISWIYDCPLHTAYSKTIINRMNHIFCFDAAFSEKIRKLGVEHIYHFPLAADPEIFEVIVSQEKKDPSLQVKYKSDISFVGDLYNGEKNRIRHTKLSDHTDGYIEGLIRAGSLVPGCYSAGCSMEERAAEEAAEKCGLLLSDAYTYSRQELLADAIGMEITARERTGLIEKLSDHHEVTLYTGSHIPEGWTTNASIRINGYADYEKELPYIFRNSKINLNITSRTIESGIPQRIFDILACGGFCLTNYQPEIEKYFVDGEEIAIYFGERDLLEKAAYFLEHEEERRRIAEKGRNKVRECFGMKEKVAEMIGRVTFQERF